MSQEKAQLIAPLGVMAVEGMTASGVITATTLDGNIVGSAKSLVNGANVSVGVITATSFTGNLTGNIARLADSAPDVDAGVTTATSFVGNLTGSVTDLTSQPAITVGMVTATTLEGPVTGNITGNVTGIADGLSDGLGINYNGGWTGAGTSQITAGVVTATTFYGDGGNLDGVSSGPVSQQSIGITSATTTIDLSNGNLVYAEQSANTTVSLANTSNGNVYFIRTNTLGSTANTITWPTGIGWSGGETPTLLTNPTSGEAQIFLLVTRNMGETWYGREVFSIDDESYSLWSFGNNDYGKLGQNNKTTYSSPKQIGTATNWKKLATAVPGNPFFYGSIWAFNNDNELWGWGANNYGELGRNSITPYEIGGAGVSSPVQLPGTTWDKITNCSPGQATGAVKTDGTLWSWGYNGKGQAGSNDRTDRSSPTQVGTGTDWVSVAGGRNGFSALKTDGTLWMWGNNPSGGLGQNNTTAYSSPVQIPGTTWGQPLGGEGKWGVIKTDGTLWTWGTGQDGAGGRNSTTTYSSPMQVGTDTTWQSYSSSYYGGGAIKTDGTLWTWGQNNYGALAHNDVMPAGRRSSPTQVGTGTDWNKVVMVRQRGFGFKSDGTTWVWGYGAGGALGIDSNTSYSSPTQLPGLWSSLMQSSNAGVLLKPQ